jgi:hypothetical protein
MSSRAVKEEEEDNSGQISDRTSGNPQYLLKTKIHRQTISKTKSITIHSTALPV